MNEAERIKIALDTQTLEQIKVQISYEQYLEIKENLEKNLK